MEVPEFTLVTEIPPSNFLACSFDWTSHPSRDTSRLKSFLLGATRLRSLHLRYFCHLTFPDKHIVNGERMPALEYLRLEGYDWQHSPTAAVNFWNWTNLKYLVLSGVHMSRFWSTVKAHNLPNLRYFVTDGYPLKVTSQCENLTGNLLEFLSGLQPLEALGTSLVVSSSSIRHIASNGQSLRWLSLIDTRRWGPLSPDAKPYINVDDLAFTSSMCPNLRQMNLDFGKINNVSLSSSYPKTANGLIPIRRSTWQTL